MVMYHVKDTVVCAQVAGPMMAMKGDTVVCVHACFRSHTGSTSRPSHAHLDLLLVLQEAGLVGGAEDRAVVSLQAQPFIAGVDYARPQPGALAFVLHIHPGTNRELSSHSNGAFLLAVFWGRMHTERERESGGVNTRRIELDPPLGLSTCACEQDVYA